MTFFTEWTVFHRKSFFSWMIFLFFAKWNFFCRNIFFFVQNEFFFSHNEIFSKGIRIFFLQINNFIWKKNLYEKKFSFCSNSIVTYEQPYATACWFYHYMMILMTQNGFTTTQLFYHYVTIILPSNNCAATYGLYYRVERCIFHATWR